jgi:hypothetical protein
MWSKLKSAKRKEGSVVLTDKWGIDEEGEREEGAVLKKGKGGGIIDPHLSEVRGEGMRKLSFPQADAQHKLRAGAGCQSYEER